MLKRLRSSEIEQFHPRRAAWAWVFALALVLWAILPSTAQGVGFSMSLDQDSIAVGESATLTMTFEGGAPDGLPMPPSVPNLKIQDAGGESSSVTIINGAISSIRAHTFSVTPSQPGNYVIPAITVKIAGQLYQSEPVRLVVTKGSTAPKTVFLKLGVSKTNLYVGEILPVEVQLLFRSIRSPEFPHLKEEGFTLGKISQPSQAGTNINGQQWNLLLFKTFVVPVKVGKLDLGPATMAMQAVKANSRQSIFGQYVDWESITVSSDPLTLQVVPLPKENMPPNFSGAVGDFAMTVTVTPTNIAVGDPLTVKVQLAGRGSLEQVTLPAQAGWEQFKQYPPTSDFQPADAQNLSGMKTFALTAVPQTMDIKELPPFVFSYFDPKKNSYQTLTQPAVPLTVRPSMASLPPPTLANANGANGNPATNTDILPIKPRLGLIAQIQSPLVSRPWFLALQAIPVIAWLALLINRKLAERLANNPRLRRERQVEQIVRQGLNELRQAAKSNDRETFFATVFRLLQERIGERLDVPASAITESVLDERLRPPIADETLVASLRELFHNCNQARYARQGTNHELISLVPKVESALEDLKKVKA